MKKCFVTCLFLCIFVNTNTALAENEVVYDPITGLVHIPKLRVLGDTSGVNYSVEMQQKDSLNFQMNQISTTSSVEKNPFDLDSPSAEPDAISLNVPTEIVFSSSGIQADKQPTTLILEEVNETGTVIATLGKLKDDGTDGDFIAGDAFFSGTFTIMGTVEGKKFYQATAVYNGKLVTSDIDFLVVTRFPVKIAPSNPDSLIKEPESGEFLYADEITLKFKEGVSADRIAEIVANEGAKIEGTMLTSGVFQLRLSGQPSIDLVRAAVAAFSAYAEVEYAEPSFQTSIGNTLKTISNPTTSITLRSKTSEYDLNKVPNGAVDFSASIENQESETITIAHPTICFSSKQLGIKSSFKDRHGKSEILVKISTPDGKTITLRDGPHFFDPGNIDHFQIPPGESKQFYVGWFFLNARGRWEDDAKAATVFMEKGQYKVQLLYRNFLPLAFVYDSSSQKSRLVNAWTGEMLSNEVIVEIK